MVCGSLASLKSPTVLPLPACLRFERSVLSSLDLEGPLPSAARDGDAITGKNEL